MEENQETCIYGCVLSSDANIYDHMARAHGWGKEES